MAIKRRSSIPDPSMSVAASNEPLRIEAKPKRPIPPGGILRGFPENPSIRRRIGLIAVQSGAALPDSDLTTEDRVTLMRTPFDPNNAQERRYRNRVRNRATAITAICITCQGGRKAVQECIDTKCPLWAFRTGADPFHSSNQRKWKKLQNE